MPKEKKEDRKKNPEANGIAGFTLGIVSIVLCLFSGFAGVLASVAGIILCSMQQAKGKTRTAKIGLILNIIGFIFSVALLILIVVYYPQINSLSSSLK